MKINTTFDHNVLPHTQNPKTTKDGFEHLLNSPTQDYSGDEYYRLHQEDLQHSSLHFDKTLPLSKENHQSNVTQQSDTPSLPDIQVKPKDSLPHVMLNTHPIFQNSYITRTQECNEMDLGVFPIQHLISISEGTNKIELKFEQRVSRLNLPISTQISHPIEIKKHHLFIEGERAELTVNLKDLNKNEQDELIVLMKRHLKQKGLVLNQLIINGVYQ